jgi:hypothetical protein
MLGFLANFGIEMLFRNNGKQTGIMIEWMVMDKESKGI